MKVIAINGSPKKEGNTSILINTVFEELNKEGIDTQLISLAGTRLQGCTACRKCFENKNKRCVLKDEVNFYLEELLKTEGMILGSPVYFADVTSEMKAFIDRVGMVSRANDDMLKRKVGTALTAVRRGGMVHAFDTMNHFFQISQIYIVSSNYWNHGIGGPAGAVKEDIEGINTMKVLGQNMAWILKKLH